MYSDPAFQHLLSFASLPCNSAKCQSVSPLITPSPSFRPSHLPLQVGDYVQPESQDLEFKECYPTTDATHRLSDYDYRRNGGVRYVTVVATYYTSCGPGRFESPQLSRYADEYAASHAGEGTPRTAFLASLKAGVNAFTCSSWATLGFQDGTNLRFLDDDDRSLQYLFFKNEHPAYVVLDHCQRVRRYFKQGEMKRGLKRIVDRLLREADDAADDECPDLDLPAPPPPPAVPPSEVSGPTGCVEPFGSDSSVLTFSREDLPQGILAPSGIPFLDIPRDLAFNPATRELYVINNNTQSVALFGGLQEAVNAALRKGAPLSKQLSRVTAANRRDRGYYHYMARGASIAFDGRGHFATCQESENNYDLRDAPNFFMGPTLYNASDSLLFQADGEPCVHDDRIPGTAASPEASLGTEPCFVAHVDMLHESPVCVGIAHDPETVTPWGNVYWAIGARYEPTTDEYNSRALTLLRYDFEVPHGIGVLDHSLANVRRYHDVEIRRRPGVPGHLVVDPDSNAIYIADTGNNRVIAVDRTTGSFDHHARIDQGGEFLLFSATEPAFEYSVYQCLEQNTTWASVRSPSGMALDANFVYVSEFETGDIVAFEKGSGREAGRVKTGARGVMGLAMDPETGSLWFVNGKTKQHRDRAAVGAVPRGRPPERVPSCGRVRAGRLRAAIELDPRRRAPAPRPRLRLPEPDRHVPWRTVRVLEGQLHGARQLQPRHAPHDGVLLPPVPAGPVRQRPAPARTSGPGATSAIAPRGTRARTASVPCSPKELARTTQTTYTRANRGTTAIGLQPKRGRGARRRTTVLHAARPVALVRPPSARTTRGSSPTSRSPGPIAPGWGRARPGAARDARKNPALCHAVHARRTRAPARMTRGFLADEDKPFKNCDWVGKKTSKRCKGARLAACPVTCGTCQSSSR